MWKKTLFVLFAGLLLAGSCKPEDKDDIVTPTPVDEGKDLTDIAYSPTAYTVEAPQGFPQMPIPNDNPMTEEGIQLGRYLFYEKALSIDNSISCGTCHQIDKAFTDGNRVAIGVNGAMGSRNTMSLINIGYSWIPGRAHNFHWDGAHATLEAQAIAPVVNPLEMANTWDTVEVRLRGHAYYPKLFRQAFGIKNSNEITRDLATKAIVQFVRTLNSANSRYDEHLWVPFEYLSVQEKRGFDLFLGDAAGAVVSKDAECAHCHNFSRNKQTFARNDYSNNGLTAAATLNDFPDKGLGAQTGRPSDNGKFREVTLRNIALTAPYMHDGRFQTLEEVLDHYISGGHASPNIGGELATAKTLLQLNNQDKEDIIAFLHALTDTSYVNKEAWKDPFLAPDPWAPVK